MGYVLEIVGNLVVIATLLGAAHLVFAKVRSEYQLKGKLSSLVAILQTGYFILYAFCSYFFLDSRLSQVNTGNLLFILAVVCILIGFLLVMFSMPFLGRRTFGMEVGALRTNGLYRYSRNPQLVGGFIFIVGYTLLWPSWQGALWASLWMEISRLMVQAEEMYLENMFGDEYRAYCKRTPRYIGWPGK